MQGAEKQRLGRMEQCAADDALLLIRVQKNSCQTASMILSLKGFRFDYLLGGRQSACFSLMAVKINR
jgi:hypothetical protein